MFFIVVGVVGHLLAARFKKFGTDIANYASLPNNFILLLFILYIIFFFISFQFWGSGIYGFQKQQPTGFGDALNFLLVPYVVLRKPNRGSLDRGPLVSGSESLSADPLSGATLPQICLTGLFFKMVRYESYWLRPVSMGSAGVCVWSTVMFR